MDSNLQGYSIAFNEIENAFFIHKQISLIQLDTQELLKEFSNSYQAWQVVNELQQHSKTVSNRRTY